MKLLVFPAILLTLACAAQLDPLPLEIPMGDGEFLAADLYQPSGCDACPVILVQTPYGKFFYQFFGLPLGLGTDIDSSPYAFLIVDWRGRFASADAAYPGAPSIGEDGYDVVEWIAAQPWCNGKIGTWGPSALGRVQYQTAQQQPPALTCICPVVAAPQQRYKDYYPGGALRTEYVQQTDLLGFGTSQSVLPFPHYNAIWSAAEDATFYADDIAVPCLMIGGWYDHNIDPMVDFFASLQTASPEEVQDKHKLLIGPWVHGGNGQASPGSAQQGELEYPEAAYYNDTYALQFFEYYLLGIGNGWDTMPAVRYFHMGENQWHDGDAWPPQTNPSLLYLTDSNTLQTSAPTALSSSLDFPYDPQDPSPTVGGPTLRADLEQGPFDQVDVEARGDILTFTSAAFTEPLHIQGMPLVHLFAGSDMPDTDFAVRLCDVYPDGRSMLITDGIIRMRFREGFTVSDTSFLENGDVYEAVAELSHTSISLQEGHKLRLGISGSNYPRFNRNMNTGGTMYPELNPDTLVNATASTNTVWMDALHASYLEIPTAELAGLFANSGEKAQLLLYPSPASSAVTVQTAQGAAGTLVVTAVSGQVLYSAAFSGTVTLDVSRWPAGFYIVQLTGSSDGHAVGRFAVTGP